MTRLLALLLFAAGVLVAQDQEQPPAPPPAPPAEPAPQEPPPQPEPQPQPEPRPQPNRPSPQEESSRAAQRQLDLEYAKKRTEFFNSLSSSRTRVSVTPESYVSPMMRHEAEFDIESIPLREWLNGKDTDPISWKVEVSDPHLRYEQRLAVSYQAILKAKDLNRGVPGYELLFISGVSDTAGRWLTKPKVVRHGFKENPPDDIEILFSDWVFVQPGEYLLWLALYDQETARHNVFKRRVRVSALKNDPLPGLDRNFGVIEFPPLTDPEGLSTVTLVRPLDLPVANQQPVAIDLVTVVNPPSSWVYSPRSIATHNNRMLTAISTLTQMGLKSGSISLTGFNTKHADMSFDYRSSSEIDWGALTAVFFRNNFETDSVSTERLLDPSLGLRFFRESLHEVIDREREGPRVLIVLSNAMQVDESSNRDLLRVEHECDCRVYYLRAAGRDGDAIERLLQPLRPRVFDINTARGFREAVAQIVRDLTTGPLLQP